MCIVMDSTNTLAYVADRHLVARVNLGPSWLSNNPSTESYDVTEFVGNQASGFLNGNGCATRFFEPRYIAIDGANKYIYVSDVVKLIMRCVVVVAWT